MSACTLFIIINFFFVYWKHGHNKEILYWIYGELPEAYRIVVITSFFCFFSDFNLFLKLNRYDAYCKYKLMLIYDL